MSALRGSGITLDKVLVPNKDTRKTKIICTLGPACWDVPTLEKLIDEGMNVARFNFSHGDHEAHGACLKRLREAASNKVKHVGVLLDTKGPEIRTGFFAEGDKIELKKGETLLLTTDYSFKGNSQKLAISYDQMASSVKPGQTILIADGSLVLEVVSADVATGLVTTTIQNNAKIGERKNCNLPGVIVDLPTLTEKDIHDIQEFGVKNNVDFIAASFVRKAEDVTKIREVLGEKGAHIKIIVKIENQEGLENYDAILAATDGVMVARGDLGMEIPPEKVFLAQKLMIRKANIAGKPVVTATQMLESMIVNPRPTRAECSDVANAVLDGTDAVMLSGETAGGEHPIAAVRIMGRTCVEAEGSINYGHLYAATRNSVLGLVSEMGTTESIASSAVKTGIDVNAKFIIVCSESGNTARLVAKYRPPMGVMCLTPRYSTARQARGVLKGVSAFVMETSSDEENITLVVKKLMATGSLMEGDQVVVVHGTGGVLSSTNQLKLITV